MTDTVPTAKEMAINAHESVVATTTTTSVDAAALPLISVIVPVYNTGAYLVDAVKSIVAQTYPHLELIIVNDASTDELTLDLLSAYEQVDVLTRDNIDQITANIKLTSSCAAPGMLPIEIIAVNEALKQRDSMISGTSTQVQVRVVHVATNQGLGGVRNVGMKASTGTYLLFLDSDDLFAPLLIEHLYKIKLRTGADMVFFNNHNFSYDLDCDLSIGRNLLRVTANKLLSCADIIKEQKLYSVCYTAWGSLFSRQVVFDHNIFSAPHVICEDSDWVVHMLLNSNSIYYTPFEGYWRLMHAAQMTATDFHSERMVNAGDMLQRMAKDLRGSPYYGVARNSCVARALTVFLNGIHNIREEHPNKKQIRQELFARVAKALSMLDVPVSRKPSGLYMQWHHLLSKLPWLSESARMNHFAAARMARLYRRYCK